MADLDLAYTPAVKTRSSSGAWPAPGRSWWARPPPRSSRTTASPKARCGESRGTRGTPSAPDERTEDVIAILDRLDADAYL